MNTRITKLVESVRLAQAGIDFNQSSHYITFLVGDSLQKFKFDLNTREVLVKTKAEQMFPRDIYKCQGPVLFEEKGFFKSTIKQRYCAIGKGFLEIAGENGEITRLDIKDCNPSL